MERVVITGIGLVTPCGIGTDATLANLMNGKSSAGPITLFEANEEYTTRFAAEVPAFDPATHISKKKLKELSRFAMFSLVASREAVTRAGLELTDEERERSGCFIGVGLGGLENLERWTLVREQKGPRKVSPYFIPQVIANIAAGQVSINEGLRGPSYCHTSACASSAHAIGEAYDWIRSGRAPVMLAGGAESTITPVGVAGFSTMFALSRRNDEPERASRPFDRDRDGFVLGEGAGTLVLESLSRAQARGADIIAEITGWSATCDAYHITKPAPGHRYAANAMRWALETAGVNPDDVDYVNAHGTSTPPGDVEESRALENVFGPHAKDGLWVSSTKSMMGHLLGASGAVELAICANAVKTGWIPPTINLDNQDPECRLDYVPHHARERRVRNAMSNSFGFGGTNAAVVVSEFKG